MRFSISKTLAVILAIFAVAFAVGGCLPFSWLQPLGSYVRRPDDVTPERYTRYLQVCWVFAFACGGLSYWSVCRKTLFEQWLRSVWHDGNTTPPPALSPPPPPPQGSGSGTFRHTLWLPAVCLVTGVALRLADLGQPMAYDEAYTFVNFAVRPWYEAVADYNSTNNHLLNTLLMHVCYRLGGASEWVLRLPVFAAGCALLPIAYVWAREWLGLAQACLVTALLAVSPLMIVYSVDARGYSFVAAAMLLLDLSVARLRRSPEDAARSRLWIAAALFVGFAAMPLMLHNSAGILAGAAAIALYQQNTLASIWDRLRPLVPPVTIAAILVLMFYAPAYIFRGLMFLRDPIMDRIPVAQLPERTLDSWQSAFSWWTTGGIPVSVWILALLAGAVAWPRTAADRIRLTAPFFVFLALTLLQRAAPMPRIFLPLFPWIALVAAQGIVGGIAREGVRQTVQVVATLVVLTIGIVFTATHPVLLYPEERTSYVSVPELMQRIRQDVDDDTEGHRLIAPLPTDLPAIFYRERLGMRLKVNGHPEPGETIWLITRRGETIDEVLSSPLINLQDDRKRFGEWGLIERFDTLELHRATFDH